MSRNLSGRRNRIIVGVIGGASATESLISAAEEVGMLIAEAGAILVCGGRTGVMEAACRGASNRGGITIGILPGSCKAEANDYVTIPIVTGLGFARNAVIALTADVLIAVGGGAGTLSEIALALKYEKPVITLDSWNIDAPVHRVTTPEEAVSRALGLTGTAEKK